MVDISKVSGLNSLGATVGKKATSGSGETTTAADQKAQDASSPDALRNQFLNILLTQMQNQNPLDPMDTKEFTGQLAQFSSLEQQINTNSKLDNLLTAIQSTASSSAFTYIGQTAEINSKDTVLQDGKANWNYVVNSQASEVTVKIKDSTGKVLFEKKDTNVGAGTYMLNADLEDLGATLEDGTVLTLDITATDIAGAKVRTDISTVMKIEGVESGPDGIDLRSGGLLYSLDDVLRFKTVKTPTTPTTETPATT